MIKGVLVFLIAIIMLPYAYADITVTLTTPDGNIFDANNVAFSCSVAGDSELSSVALYFGNEQTWHLNKTFPVSGNTTSAPFEVTNIPNNNYIWNCKAIAANASEAFSASNKTFSVNVVAQPLPPASEPVVNNPPILIIPIPNQKLFMDETYSMILQDFFTDTEQPNLQFSAAGNLHIKITITNGFATLIPDQGWTGAEKVTFSASDGTQSVSSNEVLLNVTQKEPAFNISTHYPAESKFTLINLNTTFYVNTTTKPLYYSWSLDNLPVGSERTFRLNNAAPGKHNLSVTTSDGIETTKFTWELTVQQQSAAPNNSVLAKPVAAVQQLLCGNKKADAGENCQTCPADAACEKGFSCVKGGKCQKKSILPTLMAIIFSLFALATAGYFGYEYLLKDRLFKKKVDEAKQENEVKEIKKAMEVEQPKKEEPKPAVVIINKPENKPQEKAKPAANKGDPLKDYAQKMIDKGHSREEVYQNLIKAGWPKAKVDGALKSAKVNKQPPSGF